MPDISIFDRRGVLILTAENLPDDPALRERFPVLKQAYDASMAADAALEAAKDTLAAHPDDGGGHTGLSGTLALTSAGVTTGTLGSELLAVAEKRVHGLGLLDDETILDELADVLA